MTILDLFRVDLSRRTKRAECVGAAAGIPTPLVVVPIKN